MANTNDLSFLLKSVMFPEYCIVAGDNADNNVYFQKPEGRQNAQWIIEPAPVQDYYRLKDCKHGKYLVAGERADNKLYHQDDGERGVARWNIFEKMEDSSSGVVLLDEQQHFAAACGLKNDGHVYHQDLNNPALKSHPSVSGVPPQRKCMLWKLEPTRPLTQEDNIPAPYLEYAGEIIDCTVGPTHIINDGSQTVQEISEPLNNDTDKEVPCTATLSRSITNTDELSFSNTVTTKVASGIALKLGAKVKGDGKEGSGGFQWSKQDEKTSSDSIEKKFTKEISDVVSITVNPVLKPHERTTVTGKLFKQILKRDAKVTMKISQPSGDFTKEISVTWTQVRWVLESNIAM